MSTFLIVVGVLLMIAAIVVVVLAFTRAKKPATTGARQDPLKSGEMPVFGPKQLGPGAIVSPRCSVRTSNGIPGRRFPSAANASM